MVSAPDKEDAMDNGTEEVDPETMPSLADLAAQGLSPEMRRRVDRIIGIDEDSLAVAAFNSSI